VSHALEMTINVYYPTFELFCLLIYPLPSTPQNFVYPTLFSSMPPQAKNNHRSLIQRRIWPHLLEGVEVFQRACIAMEHSGPEHFLQFEDLNAISCIVRTTSIQFILAEIVFQAKIILQYSSNYYK
jgi:hypothetical protein